MKKEMKLLSQGAEAKIYLDKDIITKHRFEKTYRHPEIDKRLRKSRTKRESKVLQKLEDAKFPAPRLLDTDSFETIRMQNVKGKKVRDILEKDHKKLSREIGKKVALLHNLTIIHGDLTTSNMILEKEIYFVDFGLSFFSHKIEDMAVDLHLLKQALESKHYKIFEEAFDEVLKSYMKYAEKGEEVLKRLEKVETRGRYKLRGKRKN